MLRYIEKLRGRPESTRKTMALFFSLVVVVAIFIAWFSSLPENLSSVEGEASEQSSSSPFELVKSGADSVYRDWNDIVDNAKDVWPF